MSLSKGGNYMKKTTFFLTEATKVLLELTYLYGQRLRFRKAKIR